MTGPGEAGNEVLADGLPSSPNVHEIAQAVSETIRALSRIPLPRLLFGKQMVDQKSERRSAEELAAPPSNGSP